MTRRPLAALGIAVVLSLGACSTSGEGTSGSTVPTDADPTTTEGPIEATTSTTEVVEEDLDQIVHDSVDTTLGLDSLSATSSVHLDVSGSVIEMEMSMELDYEAGTGRAEILIETPTESQRQTVLADGTNFWLKAEGIPGLDLPPDRPWLEGPVELLDQPTFRPEGVMGAVYGLRAASDTTVEEEIDLDGTAATVYRTSMTYSEAVEAAGSDAATFQSSLNLTAPMEVPLTALVTVDEDGVLRALDLEIDPDDVTPLAGTYHLEVEPVEEVAPAEAPTPNVILANPEGETLLRELLGAAG